MAQNRYIPYGYKMVDGAITIHPQEQTVVKVIYQMYGDGNSYLTIANHLTSQGIHYMPNKPAWNKNMIARMLKNKHYLGTEKYPAIIESDLSHAAQTAMKTYTHTESPQIKTLKSKLVCNHCGCHLRRRVKPSGLERWFCPADSRHIALSLTDAGLLKQLSEFQRCFTMPSKPRPSKEISMEVIKRQGEIDGLFGETPLHEALLKEKIISLASLKYSQCEDTYQEDMDMLQQLKASSKPVDENLLSQLIASIYIEHNSIISIHCFSGRVIEKGSG